jgi:hypothetical protein
VISLIEGWSLHEFELETICYVGNTPYHPVTKTGSSDIGHKYSENRHLFFSIFYL